MVRQLIKPKTNETYVIYLCNVCKTYVPMKSKYKI